MPKNFKAKTVTMVGGKNVADASPPRQKTPKAETTEPESPDPTPESEPKKSDQ